MWVGGTTCCAAAESLQAASLSTGRVGPCRACAAPFWLMMPAESTASKTDEGRRARNILVFSPNRNPLHDSRLLRLCAYLAGSGWAVRLMWVQGSIDRIPILPVYAQACPCVVPGRFFRDEPGKVRRLIKLLRTTWYVARALRREKSPFLWVSGLSSLALTAPYLVLHWRVRFVYDAREYSLGQHDCIGRNRKSIRQRLMICGIVTTEQWASRRAVAIVHTNRWRRRLFEHSHIVARAKSFIVENLHCRSLDDIGEEPPSSTAVIVGYVGLMSPGRGLDLLVESLRLLPSDYNVTIVGPGTEEQEAAILRHAENIGVEGRVSLVSAVPYWELQRVCRTFTCGTLLIEDSCLNNRYCSPNKIFDFIAAGCPSVVTGVPPLRDLVRSFGIGIVVPEPIDAANVAVAIRRIVENHALFHRSCVLASDNMDWMTQSRTVDRIMAMLGS